MLKIRTGRGYIKTLALGLDGKEAGVYWTTKLPCPCPESQGEWVSTSKLARTWPVESLRDFIVTMRLAMRKDPTQSYMWDKARVVRLYRKVPLYFGCGMDTQTVVKWWGIGIKTFGALLFMGVLIAFFWYNFVR